MNRCLALFLLAGCGHQVDRQTACHIAKMERNNLRMMPPRYLSVVARGSPAEPTASSAHAQQISAQVLSAIGAAALVVAFIEGFAGEPGTNEAVRNSAWGLGGTSVGTFAIALVLGLSTRSTAERARIQLADWADHCSSVPP